MRKLKFYLIGLVPGLLFVFFVLYKKNASWNYLPNSRVIAETLTKKLNYIPTFSQELAANNLTVKILKDSIITNGKIDFDRSQAQKNPCPEYILVYPKNNPKYEINFIKCKEIATFQSLKKLR